MLEAIINSVKSLFGSGTLFFEAITYDGERYQLKVPYVGVPDKDTYKECQRVAENKLGKGFKSFKKLNIGG